MLVLFHVTKYHTNFSAPMALRRSTILCAIHIFVGKPTGAIILLMSAHSPKARVLGAPSILLASFTTLACHDGSHCSRKAPLRATTARPAGVAMKRIVGWKR